MARLDADGAAAPLGRGKRQLDLQHAVLVAGSGRLGIDLYPELACDTWFGELAIMMSTNCGNGYQV